MSLTQALEGKRNELKIVNEYINLNEKSDQKVAEKKTKIEKYEVENIKIAQYQTTTPCKVLYVFTLGLLPLIQWIITEVNKNKIKTLQAEIRVMDPNVKGAQNLIQTIEGEIKKIQGDIKKEAAKSKETEEKAERERIEAENKAKLEAKKKAEVDATRKKAEREAKLKAEKDAEKARLEAEKKAKADLKRKREQNPAKTQAKKAKSAPEKHKVVDKDGKKIDLTDQHLRHIRDIAAFNPQEFAQFNINQDMTAFYETGEYRDNKFKKQKNEVSKEPSKSKVAPNEVIAPNKIEKVASKEMTFEEFKNIRFWAFFELAFKGEALEKLKNLSELKEYCYEALIKIPGYQSSHPKGSGNLMMVLVDIRSALCYQNMDNFNENTTLGEVITHLDQNTHNSGKYQFDREVAIWFNLQNLRFHNYWKQGKEALLKQLKEGNYLDKKQIKKAGNQPTNKQVSNLPIKKVVDTKVNEKVPLKLADLKLDLSSEEAFLSTNFLTLLSQLYVSSKIDEGGFLAYNANPEHSRYRSVSDELRPLFKMLVICYNRNNRAQTNRACILPEELINDVISRDKFDDFVLTKNAKEDFSKIYQDLKKFA